MRWSDRNRGFEVFVCLMLVFLVGTPLLGAWRVEGPFIGSVNDVAVSSTNPDTVYAATHGGGVWRSEDGGLTWTLPGDGMTSRNVSWVEIDPADPSRLWVGIDGSGSSAAMWRSTDRGASWEPLKGSYGSGMGFSPVGKRIAFAPPSTILVPSTNLHYRSDDGGKSWSDFRVPNQDAYAFAVHPENPKVILAGGRGQTLNISRSTDGGKSWKQTGIGLGQNSVRELFFDPVDPTVVFAVAGTFGSVFRSTDGGDDWTELTLPIGGTSKVFSLTRDPSVPGVLWAATQGGLLRSTDSGASWSESDEGLGRFLVKRLAFDPRDPSRIVAATGGTGIYRSTDGGASWTSSSDGLAAGWIEALWGAAGSEALFAQSSIGLYRRDGIGIWTEIVYPFEHKESVELDGIAFDRGSAKILYAYDTSKYWRSSDSGRSWQEVEQKGPSMRDMMKGNLDSAQFASFVQDPKDGKTFYAGSWSSSSPGGAVFKTTDGGKKWKPSGQGLPSERVNALRSEAPGTVFAVVDKDQLFRSTDGGGSWASAGSGLPGAEIHELTIDSTTPSRLFAATEKGLYRSTDGGQSWSRVGEGAIDVDDVDAVVVDSGSGAVYAGTFHGVYRSSDGGTTWSPFGEGLANSDVRALVVAGSPARLWAGLGGGSVVSTELPQG